MKVIHLRAPDDLVSTLTTEAAKKGNSLSAEIRQRLHASLGERES